MLKPKAANDRKPDGTFAIGNKVPHRVYQTQGERIKVIQGLYSAQEIFEIIADTKKLYDRSAQDAAIILQIARSLANVPAESCNDVRAERETLIDRVEGKAKNNDSSTLKDVLTLAEVIMYAHNKNSAEEKKIEAGAVIENVTTQEFTPKSAEVDGDLLA